MCFPVSKTYTYDANGNRATFTLQDGENTLLQNVYTTTTSGLLTAVQSGTDSAVYTYDKNGNMLTETVNGTLVHTNTYNNANQIKTVSNNHSASALSSFAYTHNTTGNVTNVTETLSGTSKQKSYVYDAVGRLLSETVGTASTGYTYDLRGNRLTKTNSGDTKNYSYSISNRILNGNGTVSDDDFYYHDNNLMWIDAEYYSNADSYELLLDYDSYNRIERVERYVDVNSNFEYYYTYYYYNGDNLRTSKKVDNTVTEYVWDGTDIVMEKTGTDVTVYKRGLRLFASEKAGTKTFYNFNGHGDVVQLVNASGQVIKTYEYDAFGNELNPDTADTNPFRYCAEYYDTETRYIYLRARYYSPRTGRFITEDPIRDGLNWYVYCGNNPIIFIDPSGLEYIVVSGGKYGSSDSWPYEFIETALNKIWQWKEENPDETITWLIAMAGWSETDLNEFKAAIHGVDGINVIGFDSSTELQSYINSKDINRWELSSARTNDKISKFVLFSHGFSDKISLGLGFDNSENLVLDNNWIGGIFGEAFKSTNSAFYSCNTGTLGSISFAQTWSNKTKGKTWAYVGKSDYESICDGQTLEIKVARFLGGFYWGGSWNLPKPGITKVQSGPWKGCYPFMKMFTPY